MNPAFRIVFFDVSLPMVQSNAKYKNVEKKEWQAFQDEIMTEVIFEPNTKQEMRYKIVNRCSFMVGDITGKTMLLVLQIEKISVPDL